MRISKKVFSILLVVSLVISLAVVGCGKSDPAPASPGADKAAEPVELKLSYPNSDKSLTGQAYNYFAKTIEEESKGSIKVTVYPAASLVSNTEILNAIRQGNVDIGHFVASYVTPAIKELTPLEIPGAYNGNKYYELDKATHDIIAKIFAKYGVVYLAPAEQGTSTFTSMKKVVKTPADTKGLKVRASGKWIGEAVKAWGGSAVTIALGDLSTALERGAVDSAYVGWVITGPQKLYETAPYVSFTSLQEIFGGLIMSQKSWDKLNKEQQDAIMRAIPKFMEFDHNLAVQEKEKTIQAIKDAKGTVYELTEAENKAFIDAAAPLMEEVKSISGPEGAELIKAFEQVQ